MKRAIFKQDSQFSDFGFFCEQLKRELTGDQTMLLQIDDRFFVIREATSDERNEYLRSLFAKSFQKSPELLGQLAASLAEESEPWD